MRFQCPFKKSHWNPTTLICLHLGRAVSTWYKAELSSYHMALYKSPDP